MLHGSGYCTLGDCGYASGPHGVSFIDIWFWRIGSFATDRLCFLFSLAGLVNRTTGSRKKKKQWPKCCNQLAICVWWSTSPPFDEFLLHCILTERPNDLPHGIRTLERSLEYGSWLFRTIPPCFFVVVDVLFCPLAHLWIRMSVFQLVSAWFRADLDRDSVPTLSVSLLFNRDHLFLATVSDLEDSDHHPRERRAQTTHWLFVVYIKHCYFLSILWIARSKVSWR